MPSNAEVALDRFRELIGREEAASPFHTVDQQQIDAFAEATLDRQYVHVDPGRAKKESPYGTTIAHGFLTLSMISHLVSNVPRADPDPYAEAVTLINYGLDRVRFPCPVRVDSRIRAHRELVSADAKGEHTIQLKHRVTVEIEGEEKPACVAEWITRAIYD
jgi:acyl dehydratase